MWSKIWLKYSGQTMRCIVTNNQCTVRFVITTPRAPDAVRLGNPPRKNTASLLPRCERLMSGDRATENARLWGRILEQCAAMRPCNTTSSIASSTYRRLVRRLRPHNCEAHLTPLVGMIFVKCECSCTWIVLQASIWQAVFA